MVDLEVSSDELATWLNERGRERWELVHYRYEGGRAGIPGIPGASGMLGLPGRPELPGGAGAPAFHEMVLKRPVAE